MVEGLSFPPDFLWGVAASAFQTEGAVDEDGRGPSVWDTFYASRGLPGGGPARVATDHYHRFPEDVALIRDLGAGAFRFSVAWPRVVPAGRGAVNPAGLDFYDRLVDELCAAGIAPVATLYHWDTPQPLEDAGGWLVRDTAHRFAEYAAVVAERLADRVSMWLTLNEPREVSMLGYAIGYHAPGRQLMLDALPTAHHQLLAHGLAVQALRAAGANRIGIAASHAPTWPASPSEADVAAAAIFDDLNNWLFADPILLGRYPDPGLAAALPGPVADDLRIISTPLDWYGINYYSPSIVGAADASNTATTVVESVPLPAGLPFTLHEYDGPRTGLGGAVAPQAFREILTTFRDRYGAALPPIYVTENGTSPPPGTPDLDDGVRIEYLDGHLRALRAAMDDGVDVRGYFVWSITDNIEWTEGVEQRFGLVHVDYATLQRTPKASYGWYRDVIKGAS
ncbi:GH1 family beta-glucosidase [Pseudonocardia sp. CA-107938]|uniref:GH1 family beta-glucosidase n=1 Tax=Pseudonocardia sp. CA-107938 TaxID=3240021 RepID=UPI003D91D18D